MKKYLLISYLLIAIGMFTPSHFVSAETIKIGIVDAQKILRGSKVAQKARESFIKTLEGKRNIFQARQNELKKSQEDFRKEASNMSPAMRKEKTDELQRKTKELSRLKTDLEEELKKKDKELTTSLLRDIYNIVLEIREKENFSVILERKVVIAFDNAIDITDKVIKAFDSNK